MVEGKPLAKSPAMFNHAERLVTAMRIDLGNSGITLPGDYAERLLVALEGAFIAERLTAYTNAMAVVKATPLEHFKRNPQTMPDMIAFAIRTHSRKELGLSPKPGASNNDGGSSLRLTNPKEGG